MPTIAFNVISQLSSLYRGTDCIEDLFQVNYINPVQLLSLCI